MLRAAGAARLRRGAPAFRPPRTCCSRAASSAGAPGTRSMVAALYRSLRRGARFADWNPGLRRHLLSRLVRDNIFVDGIATPEAVRRLTSGADFKLERAVSAHFRREVEQHAGGQQAEGINLAFRVLKLYSACVGRIKARQTLVDVFSEVPDGPTSPAAAANRAQFEAEEAVFEANAEFYAAIREASAERLAKVCTHTPWSGCIHPSRGLLLGWAAVSDSWAEIFRLSEAEGPGVAEMTMGETVAVAAAAARLAIGLKPESVRVNLPAGSSVAWVTGVEVFVSPLWTPRIFAHPDGLRLLPHLMVTSRLLARAETRTGTSSRRRSGWTTARTARWTSSSSRWSCRRWR